jgi:aryl-alcohol dehydrogenase-like predicted oxidoreductase
MERSRTLWRLPRLDLMQVHNLLDWETHWPVLKEMKAQGRVRYIGMTTSHGRRHDDLETILARDRLDFVQFSYNLADREVEARLLPLAAERGAAVIVNRPFDGGALFGAKTAKPLPAGAGTLAAAPGRRHSSSGSPRIRRSPAPFPPPRSSLTCMKT